MERTSDSVDTGRRGRLTLWWHYGPLAIGVACIGAFPLAFHMWDYAQGTFYFVDSPWRMATVAAHATITLLLAGAVLWRMARPSATTGALRLIWFCMVLSAAWCVLGAYLSSINWPGQDVAAEFGWGVLAMILAMGTLVTLKKLSDEDDRPGGTPDHHVRRGWRHYAGLIVLTGGGGATIAVLAAGDYLVRAIRGTSVASMPPAPALATLLLVAIAGAVLWRAYDPTATLAAYLVTGTCLAIGAVWLAAPLHPGLRGLDWTHSPLRVLSFMLALVTLGMLRELAKEDTRAASVSQ